MISTLLQVIVWLASGSFHSVYHLFALKSIETLEAISSANEADLDSVPLPGFSQDSAESNYNSQCRLSFWALGFNGNVTDDG